MPNDVEIEDDPSNTAIVSPTSPNPFHLTMALLDIGKIKAEPELASYYDKAPGTPQQRQLALIIGRIKGLGYQIKLAEVQIGMLLVEGTKIGLQRAADPECPSMRQLLVNDGADNVFLTRCITKYQIWHFADQYGCTQEQIEQANHEQLAAIQSLSSRTATQCSHIVEGMIASDGKQMQQLDEEEIQHYYDEAQMEFENTVKQEIAAILSTEHPDLYQPEPSGRVPDNHDKRIEWIIKDPEYDPETGNFSAKSIQGYINADQFPALKRGHVAYTFQIGHELVSIAEFTKRIEEQSYNV